MTIPIVSVSILTVLLSVPAKLDSDWSMASVSMLMNVKKAIMHVPKMPFAKILKVFIPVNVKMVSLVMVLSVTKIHAIIVAKRLVMLMAIANVQRATFTKTKNVLM